MANQKINHQPSNAKDIPLNRLRAELLGQMQGLVSTLLSGGNVDESKKWLRLQKNLDRILARKQRS